MDVEIISIGDELLIGQTINTNAAWIGNELASRGAVITRCSVIQDDKKEIVESLDLALVDNDVVIITGGLGPTKDDITKHTLVEYFDTELEINQEVLKRVRGYFESRSKKMLDVNIQQAAMPKGAVVLNNLVGTASGMWFEYKGKVVISLPGVPFEMKHILSTVGFEKLMSKFGVQPVFQKTIQLQGIGESYLAEKIKDVEYRLEQKNIKLAYLPSAGMVRLRFTGVKEQDELHISNAITEVRMRLPVHFIGDENESLSEVVGKLLVEKKVTLGTVESCTGGAVAKEIVRIPGSSSYFKGSIVSYANEIKISLIGVTEEAIDKYGAVSESVVTQMAQNGREKLGVDYCIATSGIAGPEGGSDDKPVGLVWIGVAGPEGTTVKKFLFGENRERNIQMSTFTALNMLRCNLLRILLEKS